MKQSKIYYSFINTHTHYTTVRHSPYKHHKLLKFYSFQQRKKGLKFLFILFQFKVELKNECK
jgi:hypothetical protein